MGLKREDAKKQFKRLSANPILMPQSEEGQREVLDCLQRHCMDADHAERTLTMVLDTCQEARVLTAAIASAASATRQVCYELPPPCETCPENDWEPVSCADGYEGVRRHRCVRGMALRDRDAAAWAELESKRTLRGVGALAASREVIR